jgi:hypothetical protein
MLYLLVQLLFRCLVWYLHICLVGFGVGWEVVCPGHFQSHFVRKIPSRERPCNWTTFVNSSRLAVDALNEEDERPTTINARSVATAHH